MALTKTMPTRSLTDLVAELRAARLVPAVFVHGIECQDGAMVVCTGLPTVVHRCLPLHPRLYEHLFLELSTGTGVRVLASWDDCLRRTTMNVAEIGKCGLWDRIVALLTEWEMAECPLRSIIDHQALPIQQTPVSGAPAVPAR